MWHAVQPVRCGYRWVLTYNLAIEPGAPRPSASGLAITDTEPVLAELREWKWAVGHRSDSPGIALYPLKHKYTEDSLSLDNLKSSDRVRTEALQEVCRKAGFDLFFAYVKKGKRLGYNKRMTIEWIANMDGHKVDYDDGFDEDDILPDSISSGNPDAVGVHGYTGNEV